MKSNHLRKIIKLIGIVALIVMVVCLSGCFEEKTTKHSYSLDEINDGVYAVYYVTHSRAPAYNYDVVMLNCGGNIKTFKGIVNITYTSSEPHADIITSNYINSDRVNVCIPKGTVEYAKDVGIN